MKRSFVILVVLAAVGTVIYFGYQRFYNSSLAASPELQTVPVERGSLIAGVSGAGNIAAKAQTSLAFRTSSKVKAVHVQAGDRVEAGQVLMELDTMDLVTNVEKGHLSLRMAEAQRDKLKVGPSPADLATAQANVESARENLARVKAGSTRTQLAAAEAALRAAQSSYQQVLARPNPSDVEQARLKLDQARNSLWSAQSQRDATCGAAAEGRSSSSQCNSAEAQVLNAEIAVQLAEATYRQAQSPATAADVQSAAAQVQRAQDDLDRLRNSPTPAEVAVAEAQVAQAESQLAKLVAGPTTEDLVIAEVQVEQARLSLYQAELQLMDSKLVAPFAGTVVAINYHEEESANASQPAVVLADLSGLEIEVALAELDVARVAPGLAAEVALDAFPGLTLRGRVSYIAPVATVAQGVVSYPVTIEIEERDPAVRPGMTAAVNIVVERREDVLLVPSRAIRASGRQRVVEVLYQGQVIEAPVSLGATNEGRTEIVSGLKEGDLVVLPGATTTQVAPRGTGLGGLFGGGGRGGP